MFRRLFKKLSGSLTKPLNDSDTAIHLETKIDDQKLIHGVRCFVDEGSIYVALFGTPSELEDGWLCNSHWSEVFVSYPNTIPLEQYLTLKDADALVPLVARLRSDSASSKNELSNEGCARATFAQDEPASEGVSVTAFRDWVYGVSNDSGFNPKQVMCVAKAFVSEIEKCIEVGESFTIDGIRLRVRPSSSEKPRSAILFRVPLS